MVVIVVKRKVPNMELSELNILLRKLTSSDSNYIPLRQRLKMIRAENPNLMDMLDKDEKESDK